MDKQTITIDLARYEELIKKEFILDKLMEDERKVNLYLSKNDMKGGANNA